MDDIELIKQKLSIVDLISEYLPLKKAGVNFKALCPFHNEKTPSFMVSPERGIWRCFGCNHGGDHFTFLMEKEGMEFKEALEYLAKKAGVVLKNKPKKKDVRDRLFEVNLKAQEFFHYMFLKHEIGERARKYLQARGINKGAIEQFGIGYAPNSWESLSKFLLKRGFSKEELITSGLSIPSSKSFYDRFRARITFPLIDTRDRVIGFAGRVLDKDEPKYINSPQTPIFDKSNFLFGLNLAKAEIKQKNSAVLVEGEIDVMLSHQSGVKHAVASKGTGLTSGQIDLVKKYTDTISLCFDTDLAGDAGARRGIEIADSAGLNIKVIQLSGGKDPAEIIISAPNDWQQAISEAVPVYDYYIHSSLKRYDLKSPAEFRKVAAELIPVWAKISDNILREHYIQKLAAILKMDEKIIRDAVSKQMILKQRANYSTILHTSRDDKLNLPNRKDLLEEYLIALLLHLPKNHIFIPQFPETLFSSENLRQIYVLLVLYLDSISFKGKEFSINDFTKGISKELLEVLDRLYLIELDEKLQEGSSWQKEVEVSLAELKKLLLKASLEKLSFEIKNAQEFGRIETVDVLNRRFRDLSSKLKNL